MVSSCDKERKLVAKAATQLVHKIKRVVDLRGLVQEDVPSACNAGDRDLRRPGAEHQRGAPRSDAA